MDANLHVMKTFTTIIESPKESTLKYDYDKELNLFRLSKMLPAGMSFPYDFGFINHTIGQDGDPLDIIVISEFKNFTGCVMDCRIIGAIKAEQTERDGAKMRNDRFIGIPEISVVYQSVKNINGLQKEILHQLQQFFVNYNAQAGKDFKPLQFAHKEEAIELILKQTVH